MATSSTYPYFTNTRNKLPPKKAVSVTSLTLNLLTTTIVAPPSNASKWQMEFNLAFKGLMWQHVSTSNGHLLASGIKYMNDVTFMYFIPLA